MSEVTHTLTLRALTAEAMDEAMAKALSSRGATVIMHGQTFCPRVPGDTTSWERPSELAVRLELNVRALSRSLHRPDCPLPATVNRGGTGRIISLLSTPELDRWLQRDKRRTA